MANVFQILGLLGNHPALVQWATSKVPEVLAAVKEVQDFLNRHDKLLREAQQHAPEFQQLVKEAIPLLQQSGPETPFDPFNQGEIS